MEGDFNNFIKLPEELFKFFSYIFVSRNFLEMMYNMTKRLLYD